MARKTRVAKNNGTYIFADFSEGMYLLDTPRTLNEQLASLALKGGRNIWAEKGALVPQYGYIIRGQIPETERILAVTNDSESSSSFFIITNTGSVYLYTAAQGLKKYKTTIEDISTTSSDLITTRRGDDLILCIAGNSSGYLFGAYYDESSEVIIDSDVPSVAYSGSVYEFTVPLTSIDYYWVGKELSVNGKENVTVTAITENKDASTAVIRAGIKTDGTISGDVTLGEQVLIGIDFSYTPEDSTSTGRTGAFVPVVMGVCANRLLVADTLGDIFYSQVGVIDGFNESYGAGYFGGFYNDTSNTLALEDFMSGALITKETGLYYLTFSSSTSTSSVSSTSAIEINIEKIAQIGQQYASDHVIVNEKVYAYDSNAGSIVMAITQNVFGSLVAGKPIVESNYLDAQFQGIADTTRYLTYNAEAGVFILYYGETLTKGMVITSNAGNFFPREYPSTMPMYKFLGFNQGVAGVSNDGVIIQDFKKGTIVEDIKPMADFEAIGLRDNRFICSTIMEITELDGVEYTITTTNAGTSYQKVRPNTELAEDNITLPPLLYSDNLTGNIYPSFALETKWANKQSNVTRIAAPMSGREGVSISITFPENQLFCLSALRLPDFSQGE